MQKLKEIFSKVLNLPLERVTNDLSPDNCATWDSLNAIILVTEIEKTFNIKFTFDEVMAVKNFSEVIKLVTSKGIELYE